MAKTPQRGLGRSLGTRAIAFNPNFGEPPKQSFSPFAEMGTSGYAVFGGRVISREKNADVSGPQRWITYADLLANTSIVAAGVRYFLNIASHAKWTFTPANDSPNAVRVAEFLDEVLNSMETPLRRVVRRASMYRFHGFGIQEWTAKRRDDGGIGLDDIEARPSHTIDRWQVDEKGTVEGVWQLSPQTNEWIYLPRPKLLYLVEDTVTDSPEGLGLFRHLIDPYMRLKRYLTLEGQGHDRDLRGIPVGRIPYSALEASVKAGTITSAQANNIKAGIENFVKIQSTAEDTSICIDSAPYVVETDGGKSISGVMQFGLELLNGQSPDFGGLAASVQRLNEEMARIIGTEHLMLGGGGGANRALSEDKSRNFYLTVNGSLADIADGINKDIVNTICDLNGIKEDLRPRATHSDVSFKSVGEITAALAQMASAGAVLAPDDPAIDDVRELLGIEKQPEMTPERMGMLGLGQQPPQLGPDGQPIAPNGAGIPGVEGLSGGQPGALPPVKPNGAAPNQLGAQPRKGSDTGTSQVREELEEEPVNGKKKKPKPS